MCLILFAYQKHPAYKLILAANRDEYHSRPAAAMHFWKKDSAILAGKDLERGGTWLGIHKTGKFAALTNYRDPFSDAKNAPSRGDIIPNFLKCNESPIEFLLSFQKKSKYYNGFNLLLGDTESLYWFSNIKNNMLSINPGIYGLSNRLLNTPWPKVESGKKAFSHIIDDRLKPETLFSMLLDRKIPEDSQLPDTGMGMEVERILSPIFIKNPIYGTRSSTVMLMENNGNIEVIERTYDCEKKHAHSKVSFFIVPSLYGDHFIP